MMRTRRNRWMSGIGAVALTGGVLVASALLWFVDPAGAVPLESWDNQIPNANKRFKVLADFNGAAVLDKETGLVWEQAPDPNPKTWVAANNHCTQGLVGGRKGWHLPMIEQLASLVDTTNGNNPTLPTGHPFNNIQGSIYWSATTVADSPAYAWSVDFFNGFVPGSLKSLSGTYAWCVRGGQSSDGNTHNTLH